MFPKGGMGKLMKQAQEMQDKMQKAQGELVNIEAEGQAGGGMVSVKVNGNKEALSVSIDEEVMAEDKEMVEDLILAAFNQAIIEHKKEGGMKIKIDHELLQNGSSKVYAKLV